MDAWFPPEAARLFSFFSLMSLMALMSTWIKQGRYRRLVIRSFYASIGLGVAFLIAALVAWDFGQPEYVIGALAMTGLVIAVVFAAMLPVVNKGYAEADQRRSLAKDI
jgi:peptidoglycan/LPS O-acetylase OafA/YrhL